MPEVAAKFSKPSSITLFTQLGEDIEECWRDQNYNEDAFAKIATDALLASDVLSRVDMQQLVDGVISGRVPAQQFRTFGQPPVNLYVSHNFIIEALFWLDSTTSIHQHGFGGAFGVLQGSSLHSRYSFQCEERVCSQMLLGRLMFESAEVLVRGDVRTIVPGDRFVHSLFHLDCPSISVVVRTILPADYSPQYAYMRPGLAVDPFYEPEPLMTQLRLLSGLRTIYPNLFWEYAERIVSTKDLWTVFKVLQLCYSDGSQSDDVNAIAALTQKRFGRRAIFLIAALHEQTREQRIIAKRTITRSSDHRYFLALLLNLPNTDLIADFIRKRFPNGDPQSLIDQWTLELDLDQNASVEPTPVTLTR